MGDRAAPRAHGRFDTVSAVRVGDRAQSQASRFATGGFELLDLYAQSKTQEQIAVEIGCHRAAQMSAQERCPIGDL